MELYARKFGGKKFMPVHATVFKRDAEEEAAKIRKRGGKARILKSGSGRNTAYVVYYRM